MIGDRGQAEVSLKKREIIIKPRWCDEIITHKLPKPAGDHGGADPLLLEAFIQSIKTSTPSASTLEQGLWSTAVGQAAEISWREHRMVELCELFED